ncbi:uncharacterized protein LOC123318024 isoform X2 [Coccinella septempunctata]|uniref:uncharacterized protein LOC123318024 isoform X2 n=1 Tax=Coccinella septempunctata TaxID=41139 RepID=UPI001D05DDB6|nr:uncharacterized protein LOC123318024 isoform X2 [Coccinella septempunctata]
MSVDNPEVSEEDIEIFDIVINSFTGSRYEIKVTSVDTVQNIKETLDKAWNIPESESILIFNEQELKDQEVLSDIGIQNGSSLYLVLKMAGGPISIGGKIYSAGVKNLKDAVERTKKTLGKKYSAGCRVLVLLYKDQEGNHNIMKVFDENESDKVTPEDEIEDPFKCQRHLTPTSKSAWKQDMHSQQVSKEDLDILESLHEEMRMKLKVTEVRKQMKEAAERRKLRKLLRDIKMNKKLFKDENSSCEGSSYIKLVDNPCLKGNKEYSDFMKYYNDKWCHAPDKSYEQLNSRIDQTKRYQSLMAVQNEQQSLREGNVNRSHYILMKRPLQDSRTKLSGEYEHNKRDEDKSLASTLGESNFAVDEILQQSLNDVSTNPTSSTLSDYGSYVSKPSLEAGNRRRLTARPNHRSAMFQAEKPAFLGTREICREPTKILGRSSPSSPIWQQTSTSLSASPYDAGYRRMTSVEDEGLVTDLDDPEVPERTRHVRELPPVVVERRNKCAVCNRRLNIVNRFDCRCGKIYCPQHRYAESHNCNFDYREKGRETITKQNPRIVGEKIKKI